MNDMNDIAKAQGSKGEAAKDEQAIWALKDIFARVFG
jgi:hypothetical protein